MAALLVRRCSQSYWLAANTRQLAVGAAVTGSVEDPVKKLFLDKIKVASEFIELAGGCEYVYK